MTTAVHPSSRETSVRGPRALTLTGVVLCVLALGLAAGAAVVFLRTLPLDVLSGDGSAGTSVAGEVTAPGSAEMVLEEGEWAIYLAVPAGPSHDGLEGDITVVGPDGQAVEVRGGASVSSNVTRGGVSAHSVGGFAAPVHGTYTVTSPAMDRTDDARLLVVRDPGFGAFFGGVAGTLSLGFAALGVGGAGLGLVIGGGIAWAGRRRAALTAP